MDLEKFFTNSWDDAQGGEDIKPGKKGNRGTGIPFDFQRQFVYSHKWQVGDLVIWDNRDTMHRGRPHEENAPRDLRRATTLDVGSSLDEAA